MQVKEKVQELECVYQEQGVESLKFDIVSKELQWLIRDNPQLSAISRGNATSTNEFNVLVGGCEE